MSAHSAENDAPKRGHLLTITKGGDWFPDQPDWDGAVTCLSPNLCGGWWECRETHEVGGKSADSGPYDCDDSDPWCDKDEFEFHGVAHTWRYSVGWTVPYQGCVVQTVDSISDYAYEIGQAHGEGTYEVDDEWGDPGECELLFVARVLPPADRDDFLSRACGDYPAPCNHDPAHVFPPAGGGTHE